MSSSSKTLLNLTAPAKSLGLVSLMLTSLYSVPCQGVKVKLLDGVEPSTSAFRIKITSKTRTKDADFGAEEVLFSEDFRPPVTKGIIALEGNISRVCETINKSFAPGRLFKFEVMSLGKNGQHTVNFRQYITPQSFSIGDLKSASGGCLSRKTITPLELSKASIRLGTKASPNSPLSMKPDLSKALIKKSSEPTPQKKGLGKSDFPTPALSRTLVVQAPMVMGSQPPKATPIIYTPPTPLGGQQSAAVVSASSGFSAAHTSIFSLASGSSSGFSAAHTSIFSLASSPSGTDCPFTGPVTLAWANSSSFADLAGTLAHNPSSKK